MARAQRTVRSKTFYELLCLCFASSLRSCYGSKIIKTTLLFINLMRVVCLFGVGITKNNAFPIANAAFST